ncbi:MAG TPA: MFS transporter [Casimicrobiaceae bacterium]|nr:MFS transporter [Casimicrobiaceae bacterium]
MRRSNLLAARYAALFALPGVRRFMLLSLPMRMPLGTVGLATLLHVREITGSIAFAGSVVGMQFVAMAATAPWLGRIVDRRGPAGVLALTGVVCPLALAVMLLARTLALSHAAILAVAVVVGASAPPVTVLIRTLWRHRLADPALRRTAFALDAVILEVAYTIGPALIAAAVAAGPASAAMALALVFTAAAAPLMFASGALAWWQRTRHEDKPHPLGPLREPRLINLFGASFTLTMAFGAIEVGYASFGRGIGVDAWGPALIAVSSIGSACGGFLYGGLHLHAPLRRQLPVIMAIFAVPLALHLPIGDPWLLAPVAFAAGALIAPAMTAVSLLVAEIAPPRYATEAFMWSGTAIVTGLGAGMSVSGVLVEHFGANGAFAWATASAALAALFALGLRRGA